MERRTKLAKRLETYYNIFLSIADGVRKPIYCIAKDIGHTGRGKRRATIAKYVNHMYEEQISFYPNIIMKTFETPKRKAYFLRKRDREMVFQTFKRISNHVNYSLFFSGECDYFVTVRDDIDFEEYDIDIVKESVLYTPLFVKPQGWNISFEDAVKKIMQFTFKKGYIERSMNNVLEWTDLDFEIFKNMQYNARKKYSEVARKVGVHQTTVKRRFMDNIMPNCEFAHYFFPKGYKYYNQSFFLIYSQYEKFLVKAFHLLPCTTYVYPFETGIGCIIFHRNINDLMTMMEKLKEEKVIDSFSSFTPLRHD